jgi:hypothetical protein
VWQLEELRQRGLAELSRRAREYEDERRCAAAAAAAAAAVLLALFAKG